MNTEDQAYLKHYASYLLSIPSNEYTTLAFVIGLLLCEPLDRREKNSLGNFLLLVGQTMITIATQDILIANRPKN